MVAPEADVLSMFVGRDAERALFEAARGRSSRTRGAAIDGVPAGTQATGEVLTGDVVEVLAELTEVEVDVPFCGSRGYGPLRRVLLGGVSCRLVRQPSSPLVVVRRGG